MSKTQPSSEYERYWVDWGRSLLLKYPNGLSKEPDFAHDGTALIVWSVDGFIKHQEAMWKVGQLVDVPIGGRSFKEYPSTVEDQIYIAHETFKQAGAYLFFAQKEADQLAERDRQAALVAKQREEEIVELSEEVAAADTIKQLDIKAIDLRDLLSDMRSVDREFLYRKLSIVQNRMIELERANARSNLRWAVIGTIVGVIGAAVGRLPCMGYNASPNRKGSLGRWESHTGISTQIVSA
jgi:hypothetical protein